MNHFIVDGRYKDILQYHGINVSEVLRKAELPRDILNHKTVTMKEAQYYRFLDSIQAVSNVSGLAVKLSTSEKIEQFSPPIFAAFCSKNGLSCIQRLSRYKKLIGPMRMEVKETPDTVTVSYLAEDETLQLSKFVAESEISFLVNILRRATKEAIIPLKVTTQIELTDSVLAEFVGITPVLGQENSILFSLADMQKPFISHDEGLWGYFEPELNRRLADLDVDDSVSARVRAALTELLPTGMCGIDEVAAELGLSRRTLQRKLSEEHTTFQKQLNSTREMLARHYILNTELSTGDIAFLLGYAELNSFLRAFAIWTGKTVTEFRQREQHSFIKPSTNRPQNTA